MYIFELLAAFLMSARASRIAQILRSTSVASLLACNDCSDGDERLWNRQRHFDAIRLSAGMLLKCGNVEPT
jgi:hypothetical protein